MELLSGRQLVRGRKTLVKVVLSRWEHGSYIDQVGHSAVDPHKLRAEYHYKMLDVPIVWILDFDFRCC